MRSARSGFTLVEVMVALVVAALLLAALAVPLASHVQARQLGDTRRALEAVAETLLGFAAAHGRLPCPATIGSRGQEAFAASGSSADGECATFHGFLPAATLGLAGLDAEGYLRDPWQTERNRVRYAVASNTVNGVARPFTRTHGVRAATLAAVADANSLLVVCSTATGASGSGCASAASQLTRRAVFIVWSPGPTAATRAASADEARNADGGQVFVARDVADGASPFDDVLHWVGIPLLAHRLLAAGRLP